MKAQARPVLFRHLDCAHKVSENERSVSVVKRINAHEYKDRTDEVSQDS